MRSSRCRQYCDEWEVKAMKWGAHITNNTTLEQKHHVISLICIIIRNLFTQKFKKFHGLNFFFFRKKITKLSEIISRQMSKFHNYLWKLKGLRYILYLMKHGIKHGSFFIGECIVFD